MAAIDSRQERVEDEAEGRLKNRREPQPVPKERLPGEEGLED